jgi:transposase
MTIEEQALKMTHEDVVSVLVQNRDLTKKITDLTVRLEEVERSRDWFQKQIFGQKSEKKTYLPDPQQMSLGEVLKPEPVRQEPVKQEVKSHLRGTAKKQPLEGSPEDSNLRFGPDVPVEEILVENPEIAGLTKDQYEVISVENTFKLAQRPGSHVVLKYVREKVKIKENNKIITPPAVDSVIENSFADVSFLAALILDKILYHLPLYRQHQRLADNGIKISRTTLTNLFHKSIELLSPIYQAQLRSILGSKVICMDETPMKVGKSAEGVKKGSGKMNTSFYWPVFGDKDEICFVWKDSRQAKHVSEILQGYTGVLLSDGFPAYQKYADANTGVTRAQCWNHGRREFINAVQYEPELANIALEFIAKLYQNEKHILDNKFKDKQKMVYRLDHSKPIIEEFFIWLEKVLAENALLPTGPFTKAANYCLSRQEQLKVFLQYPEVQIDTNHEEREIRSIAMGRKNWNFCWTEIGAQYVGIAQSLVRTCILHQINPMQYLVDVLQRVSVLKQQDVALLTPRLWKDNFQHVRFKSVFEK